MQCKCTVTASLKSLAIGCIGKKWGVIIRRLDDSEDSQFLEYHGREMSTNALTSFFPNYKKMKFEKKQIASDPLSIYEYHADDNNYKIFITREDDVSEEKMFDDFQNCIDKG